MNQKDLVPAGQLAKVFGAKIVCYGGAGLGKTPVINTAPNPVMLAVEPGLQSMAGSKVPVYEAFSIKRIEEFFNWFFGSAEAKKYDTLAIDSISQIAELYLEDGKQKSKDGRRAYMLMSENVMRILNPLYFLRNKHIYLIAKMGAFENGKKATQENGVFVVETVMQKAPYFPGQDLNVKVKHLYDQILFVDHYRPPGFTDSVPAFFTKGTDEFVARDRSGKLASIEQFNLTSVINKIMM